MPHYVGLDVSQKTTAICVVDAQGKRLWRGVCATDPGPISARISQHAGVDAKVGIETGSMTPWLVHGLRAAGLDVACLDARRVKAALQMQLNKTDENDAEGLAQIMRTGWYRAVHVKSLDAHRARALLGARAQLVGMTTRLSNMIRGVLKTFGLLPGAGRGLRFDRKVEALLEGAPEIALVVRPLLATWRHLREQIAVFDNSCDPSSCKATATSEGLGRGDRATLGFRQGTSSLGAQAVGNPAQCLAIWRAVPLGRAGHGSVAHRNSSNTPTRIAPGRGCRQLRGGAMGA